MRSYYLQTWHRISWPILNTHLLIFIHVPLKRRPSSIYNFEKKKRSISIRLLIVTNCSIEFAVFFIIIIIIIIFFFYFNIGFFFLELNKKENYYWFGFCCGYWIPWNQFRIKSKKYWYSVQWSFENFVLFYLPFPAQFFVDVKKSCFTKKENIIERGRPWLSRPEAKSPVA